MSYHKRNIFLILLNFLCLAAFVWFAISLTQTIKLLGNYSIFSNIISCLLFLVPYGCFIVFSILIFKNKHFDSSVDKSLFKYMLTILTVICLIVAVFHLSSNISSLISAAEAIDGIKDGSIYSDFYNQAQLLSLQKKLISHNICLICSNSVFLLCYIFSAILIFKKVK